MRIILGSRSPARAKVLRQLGYKFEVLPSAFDEKQIRDSDPVNLVQKLASAKARKIILKIGFQKEKTILITGDQVVVCNNKIYEKPTSPEQVHDFFKNYNKYPAETVTCVRVTSLSRPECWDSVVDRARVFFKPVHYNVVEAYIESKDPYKHAGGFDHEHVIINPYVERVEGEKESIAGLPMALTQRLLDFHLSQKSC